MSFKLRHNECSVYNRDSKGYIKFAVNEDTFNKCTFATIKLTNKSFQIEKHYFEVPKKASKKMHYAHFCGFYYPGKEIDIPPGRDYLDMEESNEDKLICYWREQI